MAGIEVIDGEIWGSAEPLVLAPPHLGAEGEKLQEGLRQHEEGASGLVFATSGTTGSPRWILHTRESLRASARMVNGHLDVSATDHWLLALPVFHVGGFGVLARAHDAGIGCDRMQGRWDPAAFAETVSATSATLTSLVPTQVHDLVAAGLRAPMGLRAVLVGGGHLPESIGERARALGWPVLPTYGLTEAGSQVATAPLATLAARYASGPLEVLEGWDVRTGDGGLLEIRGGALCRGVVQPGGGDLKFILHDPNSFWRTNDEVQLSGRMLTVCGRRDRVVKVRGELVDLDEIEHELNDNCSGVEIFYLLAISDARIGNRLVPVAVGCPPERGTAVVERLNESLPGYARLDPPEILPAVPRTPSGKVDYEGLRKLLENSAS